MENKLLKELYDHFYVRPELDEQENEVEECHKALIAALEMPERVPRYSACRLGI